MQSPTSFALLGQLALRDWSAYEMAKNLQRTLHWFWPRAESAIYSEMRRLAEHGWAERRSEPGERGRPRSVYSITEEGRAALREWLSTEPEAPALHDETLLRVHLAPWGTKDDLVRALERAGQHANDLLTVGRTVGAEFASGRHQFQDQVHIRAALFDYLWSLGLMTRAWADRWLERTADWADLEPSPDLDDASRQFIDRRLGSITRFNDREGGASQIDTPGP